MTRTTIHHHRRHSSARVVVLAAGLGLTAVLGAQRPLTSWPLSQAPAELGPVVARADLVVVAMQDAVLRELTSALTRGTPASAIGSCHLDATFVAQRVAREEGIAAGRTSDRLRNPTNAPKPWAAALVRANAGKQAKEVEGFVVDLGEQVGVLRPIAQRAMCAGCHGPAETLSAGVKNVLADRYPVDHALGFKEGEIRGWFWVEMPKRPR